MGTRMIKVARFAVRKARILKEFMQGLDFSAVIHPEQLGLDATTSYRGSPSGNKYLKAVMADLPLSPMDAILDIGCAKGSALACMSEFPFARVEGIEISTKLASICIRNFQRLKRPQVKVYNIDATLFTRFNEFQYFYFYNPFPVHILKMVLTSISQQCSPKAEVIIIYNNPPCERTIQEYGFIKWRVYPDEWGNGIHLYSNRQIGSKLNSRTQSGESIHSA